jgi:hypothetical protein
MPASERSLSFTGPMAAAILAGRKTQTRRLVAPSKVFVNGRVVQGKAFEWTGLDWSTAAPNLDGRQLFLSRGADSVACLTSRVVEGARVMVKEPVIALPGPRFLYHGQRTPDMAALRPRSPRFMPKVAARLWLVIEAARFERLQDITRGDAMGEGCPFPNMATGANPRDWFRDIWNDIHGPEAWDANPWVLAIRFRKDTPHAA